MKQLYLDVHVIQTVPPSCVNRDDTGSPKTAVYGGTTRARVSSQAWKRAMRLYFADEQTGLDQDKIGIRSKKVLKLLEEELAQRGYSKNAKKAAEDAFKKAGIKLDKDNNTGALFFISWNQVQALADAVMSEEDDAKKYKEALRSKPSVDLALFGRMVASDASLNFDACSQVAHSISTHSVQNEYDYFIAVDDLKPEESSGAGHIGIIEYQSATLYRYATVNISSLKEMLGTDTLEAVNGFVKAFLLSMPSGHQNSFANRTTPDFAYITLRDDQPVNMAGAFEKPVYTLNEGYVKKSIEALRQYAQDTYDNFISSPVQEFHVGECSDGLGKKINLKELEGILGEIVPSLLGEE